MSSSQNRNGAIVLAVIVGLLVWSCWGTSPGPSPDPNPPQPVGKLARVMLIHETGEADRRIVLAVAVSEWLKRHCVVDTDAAGTLIHGFRLWDDDYTEDQLQWSPKPMAELYAIAKRDSKGALPWCVIADKDSRVLASQAFSTNTTDQLELLKKYGGE